MVFNYFKYFKYKAELLGNKVANGANEILRNATIAVPVKDLIIFRDHLICHLIAK